MAYESRVLSCAESCVYVSNLHVHTEPYARRRTSPMRVPECVSMLLFRLCAVMGAGRVSTPAPTSLSKPSDVLLKLWVAGDSSGRGQAAVSPVRGAFAAAMSIWGSGRASPPWLWRWLWIDWVDRVDGVGIGASVCLLRLAALAEEGAVESVSVVVEVDRLLDDDGKAGAEKVLDTTDWAESCESGNSSGLSAAAAVAVVVAV